ncbi:polygalacturonase-like [Musa acuminata AAA Group]|uniref:polygalacturonase-like n=1 Tax=Musa acuminata AAA Group TaxID=214697 RepID=UPI0031D013CF
MGEKNRTQFQADATNSSLVAGGNPADSGDDKGTFHGVSICRGLSSTHLEENSTMASLEGERLNTTVMKCSSDSTQKVVNVQDYGAKGDVASTFMAFEKAWKKAGSSSTRSILLIMGTLEASRNQKEWGGRNSRHWILLSNIENVTVRGGGTINGNGKIWWRGSCKVDESMALSFNSCKNLRVENLKVMDSPRMHISLEKRTGADASHPTITTSDEIPNTDGICVTHSKRVKIANSLNLCA